jgi:y4mF family transcriptional regulator
MKTEISKFLKDMRKSHRFSQMMLAKKAGVGLHFIRDIEQGKATLCLQKLNQVLEIFHHEMHPVRKRTKLPYNGRMQKLKVKDISDPEKLPGEKSASFLDELMELNKKESSQIMNDQ